MSIRNKKNCYSDNKSASKFWWHFKSYGIANQSHQHRRRRQAQEGAETKIDDDDDDADDDELAAQRIKEYDLDANYTVGHRKWFM